MKQALLQSDTPTTEHKSISFRWMVKKEDDVKEIIKAAVDMELIIDDPK